ncbi:hypothetical protein XA68_15990 [Ophiocordyceps unilateralis]|uniref:Heme haloperoxidase family profile domain-containing protein n=1 Tax=Ophiocordyceps unilateralis TaxID=268505 RepID=A0A2A9PLU3_OPHUN|nr:hypothetical protein XA68_15990 [Ophiocordyceps unilateralis]
MALPRFLKGNSSLDRLYNLADLTSEAEHDNSFSREDPKLGDASAFNETIWNMTLGELRWCGGGSFADARCFGIARTTRILDSRRRNPKAVYDVKNAASGAVQAARAQLSMGDKQGANISYIDSLFRYERLPVDLGWRPTAYSGKISDTLDVAAGGLQVSPGILQNATDGKVATRLDIIRVLGSWRRRPSIPRSPVINRFSLAVTDASPVIRFD